MAYKMMLNKEKFLKTEFGGNLQECIASWDMYLTKLSEMNYQPSGNYQELRSGAIWCQAQWEVYKMALMQFYSIEYNFTRTDEYYGICENDGETFLFKVERNLCSDKKNGADLYRVFLKEPTCVSGPFTHAQVRELSKEPDADLFSFFTSDEYKQSYGMEVEKQL